MILNVIISHLYLCRWKPTTKWILIRPKLFQRRLVFKSNFFSKLERWHRQPGGPHTTVSCGYRMKVSNGMVSKGIMGIYCLHIDGKEIFFIFHCHMTFRRFKILVLFSAEEIILAQHVRKKRKRTEWRLLPCHIWLGIPRRMYDSCYQRMQQLSPFRVIVCTLTLYSFLETTHV